MRVVAYYRMSTDKQDTSIEAQRDAVERYAKQLGYVIVREYVDSGISGDATEKRLAFQRMIADAKNKADFEAVLCWDQSRFGRFDSLEAGFWIFPLIQSGVSKLITVADGVVDWARDDHRMLFGIKQDAGMRRYLTDLARNITRGQINRAKKGLWVSGRAPYGYAIGESGRLELADSAKVETVKRIFAWRLDRVGYFTIAKTLNHEGIASPKGSVWSMNAVKQLVKCKAYTGDITHGSRRCGKYFTSAGGNVTDAKSPEARIKTGVIVRDAHPAIIDRPTWEAVNTIQADSQRAHRRGENEGAPLAGLLYCGLCGSRMASIKDRRKSNANGKRYRCSTYHSGAGCHCCEVEQVPMFNAVVDAIRERVLLGSWNA